MTIYDNTTCFSSYTASVPGSSALLGEEYELQPGARILGALEFEVTYTGNATTLDMCDVDFYFYDGYTGAYIDGVTFANLDTGGLMPCHYAAFFSQSGLDPLYIVLADHIIVLQSVYNMSFTGGSGPGRYAWGRQLMNSYGEIGYSENSLYKDTTVGSPPGTEKGWYWFDYQIYMKANFYFSIRSAIPEPASVALLALGALTLVRRR